MTVIVAMLLSAFLFQRLVRRNNERRALEAEIRQRDMELVTRRAITRDLERYRAEHAKIVAQLKQITSRMSPDLEAIRSTFVALGVKVELGPAQPQGLYQRQVLVLRGEGTPSLAAATVALQEALLVHSDREVLVDERGRWSWTGMVFTSVEGPPKPSPQPLKRRWYSRLNQELWDQLERKTEERRELDRQIGAPTEFPKDKRRLEQVLQVYDQLRPLVLDFGPLVELAFSAPKPLLSSGELKIVEDQEGIVLRGVRANPLPATPDPCCRLLADNHADPWITRWALQSRTSTASNGGPETEARETR